MGEEQLLDIKHNIGKLFDQGREMGEQIAVQAVILPRIEKMIEALPCSQHSQRIGCLEKGVASVEFAWKAIVGSLTFTGLVLGVIFYIGRMLGKF